MNHRISKELVLQAKGTKRAIALEDLTNIRTRTRFRKAQRNRMGGWAFSQLRLFITYKALMHGVRVILVDPAYTSQTCSDCGTIDKKSRISQAEFVCTSCGYTIHADWNGSINIRKRALVNAPKVSEQPRSCAA
jgi:IS605 OrfB family transposase